MILLPHNKPGRKLLHSGTDLQLCPQSVPDTAGVGGSQGMPSPRAGTQGCRQRGHPAPQEGGVKPTPSQGSALLSTHLQGKLSNHLSRQTSTPVGAFLWAGKSRGKAVTLQLPSRGKAAG